MHPKDSNPSSIIEIIPPTPMYEEATENFPNVRRIEPVSVEKSLVTLTSSKPTINSKFSIRPVFVNLSRLSMSAIKAKYQKK